MGIEPAGHRGLLGTGEIALERELVFSIKLFWNPTVLCDRLKVTSDNKG